MPLLEAGIGAVGSVLGNVIGNAGQRRRQEEANRQNIQFWRMQNEYNHPSKQMARLREAGLNPNLIYGDSISGVTGKAESIAPSKPAPYNFENPLKELNTVASFKQLEAQTDNLLTQNTVLTQEAMLKAMQTAETGIRTARGKFDLNLARELKDSSLEASKLNVKQLEQNIIGSKLDNQYKSETIKNRIKDMSYQLKNSVENLEGKQLDNAIKRLDVELMQLGLTRDNAVFYRFFNILKDKLQKSGTPNPVIQKWLDKWNNRNKN